MLKLPAIFWIFQFIEIMIIMLLKQYMLCSLSILRSRKISIFKLIRKIRLLEVNDNFIFYIHKIKN